MSSDHDRSPQLVTNKPQHNNLRGQLEVLELNLPNLK